MSCLTTGLQNNLHRWYDASVGSWINEDPIGFEGGDANLYRYCGNDPVNGTDPNGLWFGFLGQGLDAASDACSWAWNGAVGISQDIGTSLGDVWGGLNYGVPDAMINRKLREIGTRHIARGGDDFDTYRNSYRAPESTANAISGLANYYLEFLGWGAGCVSPSKIAQEASEVAANRAMREWAESTISSAFPKGRAAQSFARETTELGGAVSREGITSGLRGTTRQADRIADAIADGRIRLQIVDDATFVKAYRALGGGDDIPSAFKALDDLVYIRRSSPTPLSDVVHEGTHVLQGLSGFRGTVLMHEIQAYLNERFFRKAIGLESVFSTESLEVFVKNRYPNWAEMI